MKATVIGNEHMRHEMRLKEIETFYDILHRHGIKKGKRFTISLDEGVMECVDIRHDDLIVEYCRYIKDRKIITSMELYSFNVGMYKKHYQ